MRLELVSIPTPTTPLDGLFYEPDGGATAGGVLLFHGNTMNFYVGALRFLHFYNGKEDEVAEVVTSWLARML